MAKDKDGRDDMPDMSEKWAGGIGMGPDGVNVIGYVDADGKMVITSPPKPPLVVGKDGFYINPETGDFVDEHNRPSLVPVKYEGPPLED